MGGGGWKWMGRGGYLGIGVPGRGWVWLNIRGLCIVDRISGVLYCLGECRLLLYRMGTCIVGCGAWVASAIIKSGVAHSAFLFLVF